MSVPVRLFKLAAIILAATLLLVACMPAVSPAPGNVVTDAPAAPVADVGTKVLILATTTSTQDSGLLEFLLPDFEQEFNTQINVIAVGSGQALQMGEDGDADVLLVHSPAAEKTFMEESHGVRREDVMYNDYVIVGPVSDPAKIAGMKTGAEALAAIAAAEEPFISRGDDSGTHNKEKALWKAAAIEPAGDWYVSAGQGMGAVLTMTKEKLGYTISDRATYLAQVQQGLDLKILVEGDKALFNPYGVIAVDPKKNPKIQNELANQFINWIVSVPVQEKSLNSRRRNWANRCLRPARHYGKKHIPPAECGEIWLVPRSR